MRSGSAIRYSDCAIYTGFFILSFAFYALSMWKPAGVYDEGLILTGAMRVAAGDIPHRDFYAYYGPAQFYVLAGLFKLFGQSIFVERIYDITVRAALTAVCFRLLTYYCRPLIALLVTGLCVSWIFICGNYGYPIFPALLFVLLGALLLLPCLEGGGSPWKIIGAGMMTGLAALFRYDVGFFVLTAQLLALFLHPLQTHGKIKNLRRLLKDAATLVIGVAAVFLPFAIAYLLTSPFSAFWHDVVTYPTHYYARARSMPFPGFNNLSTLPETLIIYFPVMVCGLALANAAAARARSAKKTDRKTLRAPDAFILLFSLLSAFLYLKGFVRVSALHMLLGIIPAFMLLAVLAEHALSKPAALKILILALAGVVTISTAWQGWRTVQMFRQGHNIVLYDFIRPEQTGGAGWCHTPPELMRIDCFSIGDDRAAAARFIVQKTAKHDRVFFAPAHNDKIFVDDNIGYFAAGRLPATRWHDYNPGLQNRADIQTQMIGELKSSVPRYIVETSEWDNVIEPNDSAKSSGVFLLDDYIKSHYHKIRTFGSIQILVPQLGPHVFLPATTA